MRAILKRLPGIERYNQIVWAIIGSGVVAVVAFSITAGVAAMLYSAYTSRTGMQVAVVEKGGARRQAGFKWGGEIAGKLKDFMHFSVTGY